MHISTPLRGLAFILSGLSAIFATEFDTQFNGTTWHDKQWKLKTTVLDQGHYQSRISLANGYLGINVASAGPFFEADTQVNGDNVNGWPLFDRRQTFATIAGFYDYQNRTNGSNYDWLYQYQGESVISGIPHWGGLTVECDGALLNAQVNATIISNYVSTLDIKKGLMKWSYTWSPSDDTDIDIEYRIFVHKLHVNQAAVQLKLSASSDANVTVYDILDGDCAVRSDFVAKKFETDTPTIWSAVRPNGINNVTAYIYSTLKANDAVDLSTRVEVNDLSDGFNASSIAQSIQISLTADDTAVVEKHIGGASTDAFTDPQAVARNASLSGAESGFGNLLESHIKEWHTIMPKDSVDNYLRGNETLPLDPYLLSLQITSVTSPFHILQNTVGPNAIEMAGNNTKLDVNSISVCGLGSDCYAGLIFWDAEVWMAPGLDTSHPQHVKQISNYRVEKYGQAKQNIKTAYQSSQNKTGKFSEGGAVYPWTSGRYGDCTGTGPCFDYEYHINGDIGLQMYNYYATTGDFDYFKNDLLPIYNSLAYFYSELLTLNSTTGFYELLNATDPDEYANNVDQAGYTTALIQKHLNETNDLNMWFGLPINDTWTEISSKMRLPVNEEADIILEYGTMNGSISVKQADVILIDDILDYPNPYSLSDLDYYAAKQSADGPGMTYGVFSIIANEISPSGCSSFTYDLVGSLPYTRGPWFQFSEQLEDDFTTNGGTHPAYPFLTGMGGANRVAIFGFLGLRLFADRLDVDPSLPPQIPWLKYRTFYWQGHAFSAVSDQYTTNITRLPAHRALPTANSTFFTHPIPVTLGTRGNLNYTIAVNGTLTIANRMIGLKKTVAGNILQCLPANSSESFVIGQYPLAAIDGAASTKWQPTFANSTAVLTVDLGANAPTANITEIRFDWAAAPPAMWAVVFSKDKAPALESYLPFNGSYRALANEEKVQSNADLVNVTSQSTVTISAPYNATEAVLIRPYVGNSTNVTLSTSVATLRYAHLLVYGAVGTNNTGEGATVAEWVLVEEGEGGNVMRRGTTM